MDQFKIYAYMMPLAFIVSWATTSLILRALPRLRVKEGRLEKPVRPEIGGLAVSAGLLGGIFASIGFISYSGVALDRLPLMGAVTTLAFISFISLFDDAYFSLRQQFKPLTLLLGSFWPSSK